MRLITLLAVLAIAITAALLLTDRAVPVEMWAVVGLVVGAAIKRPGDTSPAKLAETLVEYETRTTR